MGKFFIFFGIVLILVAAGIMIAVFSVENIPFIEDIIVEQFCEPGETSISSASRLATSGTQNSTTVWFCDDGEGNQREITGAIASVAIVGFIVPFLTGMLLTFIGAFQVQRNVRRKIMSSYGIDNLDNVQVFSQGSSVNLSNANLSPQNQEQVEQVMKTVMGSFGAPASSSTLAERLQQLEEARDQGLISSAEYQRTRQAILDSMDDNL